MQEDGSSEDDLIHAKNEVPTAESADASPGRRSVAAVQVAKHLLGFTTSGIPSVSEVEEAFRQIVRTAHPDRAAHQGSSDVTESRLDERRRGWAVSQLTWARKVLREAAAAGVAEDEPQDAPHEVFMLAAPTE